VLDASMLTGPVPITSANLVISPTLFADEAKEKAVFLKLFTENIATIKETVYEKAGIVIDDTFYRSMSLRQLGLDGRITRANA
jgi:hypothetical protein